MTDWFSQLTGFRETTYQQTREGFELEDECLRSRVTGRSFGIGRLETPSLAQLRERAAALSDALPGRLRVCAISGEARALHRDPAHRGALFQVASQFNLLEMPGPHVTPENGVTGYADDHTQGPACAIAAGGATIYRNYFAPVAGAQGQTHLRQIDCLKDLGDALGNTTGALWTMRNGYALCTEAGLTQIDAQLSRCDEAGLDALRGLLRIGLHWRVEVTDMPQPTQRVSQAFCSALPVSYTRVAPRHWQRFASLVLEATYEATLCAGLINAVEHRQPIVLLTSVGGGAFGNDEAWILAAQRRAFERFAHLALDVRVVSYRAPSPGLLDLIRSFD